MSDRTALIAYLDRYTEALAAKDWSRLPLADGVRFTENGQAIKLGQGLWGTVSGVSPARHAEFADPETGEAGFFAVVEEHGVASCAAVRLKVEDERISEIETLVVRPRETLFNPPGMAGESWVFQPVAPGRRASRAEMVRIANLYFDGIEQDDGSIIPVNDDCVRFENGLETVGPNGESSSASMGINLARMGVAGQISTGYFKYISRIRDRRYPIIDEEQGLVFGIVVFDHPGNIRTVEVKGFGKLDLPRFSIVPSAALIFEAFQIEDGKIRGIEAILDFFPFGMPPGW